MLAWRLRKFRMPGVMREVTFKVMRRTLNTIRLAALLAGFGLVMAAAGCSSIPGASYVSNLAAKTFSPGRISHEELRDALVQFASRFEATIIATADTIAAGSKDPVMQRRTLRWKLGMTPVVNQAAFLPEPVSAYVGMLTLATSMQQYLATGSGREVFGEQQQLAVDASDELVATAIELGERFLNPKELARVTQQVQALVQSQPIRGEFVAENAQSLVNTSAASATFDWLTTIPMSPFRALQGVDAGAQAIREINTTAMEVARIGSAMPRLIRWNLQLLALDVASQGNIAEVVKSFESLAQSAESLSATAGSLPEDLRGLLGEAERAGKTLGPLSMSLENTATAVAEAGQAWGGLIAELSKPPADPSKPARPFDIREWEAAASQISSAASELHTLLESAGTLAGSDVLAGPLAEVEARVDRLEAVSQELVDRIAWRGVQLILLVFGLLFAYRFVSHFLESQGRRRERP